MSGSRSAPHVVNPPLPYDSWNTNAHTPWSQLERDLFKIAPPPPSHPSYTRAPAYEDVSEDVGAAGDDDIEDDSEDSRSEERRVGKECRL